MDELMRLSKEKNLWKDEMDRLYVLSVDWPEEFAIDLITEKKWIGTNLFKWYFLQSLWCNILFCNLINEKKEIHDSFDMYQ